MATTTSSMDADAGRWAAITFGIVFVIIGILGYFPNPLVGPDGFFLTNTAHDWVHILSGVIFLISSFVWWMAPTRTLQGFWIVYGLIAIIGLFMWSGMLFWFIAMNGWDTVLHIVIAAVALYLGYMVYGRR